ncbi:MAG: O-methyltransferase [Candidatus Nanopelagicales bacterium]|jgi:predicted O-methyltransferase YrrM|nr:O-methyltransferase [Candidatus Nanopelagicales bacterium]
MCAAVTPPNPTSWTYAEHWLPEEAPAAEARVKAAELGCEPIGRGGASALTMIAALLDARAVVEVGTGAGISGLALLRGMRADGVLTSVDVEAEHQRVARATFTAAGINPARTRLITGRALEVLPRLTDAHYDIVFVDGDKSEYAATLEQAVRLLRPGGVVVFDNALWHDKVADPAQRDPQTVGLRELVSGLREDERFTPALLPVGDGLLVGVLRGRA